jgi:hypothetical protein
MLALTATFLLATSSLTFALPTTNSLSHLLHLSPRQIRPLVATLSYPNNFNAKTCPVQYDLSGNAWAAGIQNKKKRSSTSTLDTRANPEDVLVCTQVANTFFQHWVSRIANTQERQLQPGITYIFSFGCNVAIDWVQAWTNTGNGHYNQILHQDFNVPGGRVTLTVSEAAAVHFEVRFSNSLYYSGEFALFQLPQNELAHNIATGGGGAGRHDRRDDVQVNVPSLESAI